MSSSDTNTPSAAPGTEHEMSLDKRTTVAEEGDANTVVSGNVATRDSRLAMTSAACEQFRLMDLPAELWSRICRLSVVRDEPTCLYPYLRGREFEDRVRQPGITRVCKVIRAETLGVHYANAFVYKDVWKSAMLVDWLRQTCAVSKYKLPSLTIESWEMDAERWFRPALMQVGLKTQVHQVTDGGWKGGQRRRLQVLKVVQMIEPAVNDAEDAEDSDDSDDSDDSEDGGNTLWQLQIS